MRFHPTLFSRAGSFWLGIEIETGRRYLGIPVSNTTVDYIEYYWIDDVRYQQFLDETERAFEFAEACRRRENDALLVLQPGWDRGVPRLPEEDS